MAEDCPTLDRWGPPAVVGVFLNARSGPEVML